MGRAPRTKETLPDFLKWRRVTRPPLVFRGLTGSQRTPGFWGVTVEASKISLEKVNEELLKKNELLLSSLSKFSCGQKAFEMILASQKCVFDKRG